MKTLADLPGPAAIQRKPLLEREVQAKCVEWMRGRGYWARKFSSMTQRSVPDYLFARKIEEAPLKFATEFKREGAKRDPITGLMSTEAQIEEQEVMRTAGWFVFECDNFELFKQTVQRLEGMMEC